MAGFTVGMCWLTLPNAGFIELIELSARFGFPTVSLGPVLVQDRIAAGDTPAMLRKRIADAGVRIAYIDAIVSGLPGLDPPTPPSDPQSCFEAAEMLEAPMVNAAHYKGRPVGFDELVDGVGALCRDAARHGLTVGLEPIAETGFPDLATTERIVVASGEGNCGLLFDPTHWSNAGSSVEDIRALAPGRIIGFQLCDITTSRPRDPAQGMFWRDLPGEGDLPLWEVTEAVFANNPALTVELEALTPQLRDLPSEAGAVRCREAMDAWVRQRPSR
jgi:sugar phosphate isomerase/epimerase